MVCCVCVVLCLCVFVCVVVYACFVCDGLNYVVWPFFLRCERLLGHVCCLCVFVCG